MNPMPESASRRLQNQDSTSPTAPREAEAEFDAAIQDYKRLSGRLFPTWSEVLEVAVNLGYAKPHGQSPTARIA